MYGPHKCQARAGQAGEGPPRRYTRGVAKYDALRDYLRERPTGQRRVTLTFRRIEELLEEALPPSASKYEAWWIGGRAPVGKAKEWRDQVQEQAWSAAGWAVDEVDLLLKNVSFRRLAGY